VCADSCSVCHSTKRGEVFEKAGLFNENLLRTEDNEMHYRIRQNGYRFCYDPEIISYQYARNSLPAMIKQKYSNGYWIGLTLGVCPGCISLYHLVPFAFVLGIIFTSLLCIWGIWQLAALMWGMYLLFGLFGVFACVMNRKANVLVIIMPIVFFLLHVAYSVGTSLGV